MHMSHIRDELTNISAKTTTLVGMCFSLGAPPHVHFASRLNCRSTSVRLFLLNNSDICFCGDWIKDC